MHVILKESEVKLQDNWTYTYIGSHDFIPKADWIIAIVNWEPKIIKARRAIDKVIQEAIIIWLDNIDTSYIIN